MSDFWTRALGGQQPPPHIQTVPGGSTSQGAWWSVTPASPHVQVPPPQAHPGPDSAVLTYQQLKSMNASDMSQDMMEALAEIELTFDKYNQSCDRCGSANFIPAGTRVGNFRMPTAKCFECGNSSGAVTNSPEPAVGGSTGKAGRATRQTAMGGLTNVYGRHHSELPDSYIPRGA